MNVLNKISIRSQAVLIFALTAVWYVSSVPFSSEEPATYWIAIYCYMPFILLAFAGILLFSYYQSPREQRRIVHIALLTAVSPWLAWFLFSLLK
jgi:presenilin-like A22 family membrane protease